MRRLGWGAHGRTPPSSHRQLYTAADGLTVPSLKVDLTVDEG